MKLFSICKRCETVTIQRIATALRNPWASNGADDVGGITLTESGPAAMVEVVKCLTCGHSVTV